MRIVKTLKLNIKKGVARKIFQDKNRGEKESMLPKLPDFPTTIYFPLEVFKTQSLN
jgi:hypothetical protein